MLGVTSVCASHVFGADYITVGALISDNRSRYGQRGGGGRDQSDASVNRLDVWRRIWVGHCS